MAVDYHRYMASREWALKREAVKDRSDNICERCYDAPVQSVHHLSYQNLGNEEPNTELLGVCRACHEFLSAKRDTDPAVITVSKLIEESGLTPEAPDHFGLEFCGWTTGPTSRGCYFHGDLKTTDIPEPHWDDYNDSAIVVISLRQGVWYHCSSY